MEHKLKIFLYVIFQLLKFIIQAFLISCICTVLILLIFSDYSDFNLTSAELNLSAEEVEIVTNKNLDLIMKILLIILTIIFLINIMLFNINSDEIEKKENLIKTKIVEINSLNKHIQHLESQNNTLRLVLSDKDWELTECSILINKLGLRKILCWFFSLFFT